MNADVIAMDVGGNFFGFGGVQSEADALFESAPRKVSGGPAMLQEEKLQAGAFAVLAQDFGFTKEFRDTARHGNDLIPLHESVQADGEMRIGGKPAGDAQRKADFVPCERAFGGRR